MKMRWLLLARFGDYAVQKKVTQFMSTVLILMNLRDYANHNP